MLNIVEVYDVSKLIDMELSGADCKRKIWRIFS